MTMTSPDLRISLSDVARLAKVQRPVVSMWRSRGRRSGSPFPEPLTSVGGQQWFDAEQVVEWLERSGRGNNPTARLDLAAFAAVDGHSPAGDAEVFAGLTALLCLAAYVDHPLAALDDGALLDLADENDEDDTVLYSEIAAFGPRLTQLARYVDLLGDAAHSPQAAFESLMAQRFRLFVPGHTEVALEEDAYRLVSELVAGLVGSTGATAVVDPTTGGSDLLMATATHLDGGVEIICAGGDDPAVRLARRRLLVHHLSAQPLTNDEENRSPLLPPRSVAIAQYPTPARTDLGPAELLGEVEDLALQLHPDQFAVVVAPASVLIGALDDLPRGIRSDLLRTARVRALVLLPAGLVRRRPRQQLALWLFGPSAATGGASRVAAADLTTSVLDEVNRAALITDVLASLAPEQSAHHPHFVRQVAVSRLLERSGALLPPVAAEPFVGRSPSAAGIADLVIGLHALALPVLPQIVAGTDDDSPVMPMTVGAALTAKALIARPGSRLQAGDIGEVGTPVIGVRELIEGGVGTRRMDRLVFARYSGGQYTEPGDVVFCTAPHPAAWVDRTGGSVVEYPARALRVSGSTSGMTPQTLAHDIRRGVGHLWRSWTLRILPQTQAESVDQALASLRRHHDEMTHRLALLERLADQLTAGVSAGSVRLRDDP